MQARGFLPTLTSLLLSGAVLAQAPCPPVRAVDDFEGGANRQGWSFNVMTPDTIESSGGNPGGWLRNTAIVLFAPILTSDARVPGAITGDYRALGVTEISFDARTDGRAIGNPSGFAMSLVLRDTKGTQTVTDDDFAYKVGPEVPQIGEGWKSYDFAIPISSTAALPPGWTGGSGIEPTEFRPGVDWNDVITNVDSVEFWWMDLHFQAIITFWEVGVDNIAFEQTGEAWAIPRNGSGANPQTLTAVTPPVLGASWDTALDCSAHTAGFAALLGSALPSSGIFLPIGEVLVDPAAVLVFAVEPVAVGTTTFSFPLPNAPVLCGLELTLQGVCSGAPEMRLTNALDFSLGH